MKNEIEVCARAIIKHGNKILVCKNKEKDYYFFPGGHIDFGENAEGEMKLYKIRNIMENFKI